MKRVVELAVAFAVITAMLTSCARQPACPTTVAQADSGEFDAIGDGTFVGTGYAIRFVPAPDAEFRGYDLNVRRWIHGRPDDPVIFLLTEEIPGIRPGQPVLIIVEPEDNGRGYGRGVCEPLQPISEEDMTGYRVNTFRSATL